MKKTIIHVFDIHASLATANAALTTIQGLSGWWTTDVTGTTAEGGVINFRFAEIFKPDMKVLKTSGNEVQWECVGGVEEWAGDIFTFSLQQNGDMAKLSFKQEYAGDISDEAYGRFNFNWGYYLNSMKQYCETGKGAPYPAKK